MKKFILFFSIFLILTSFSVTVSAKKIIVGDIDAYSECYSLFATRGVGRTWDKIYDYLEYMLGYPSYKDLVYDDPNIEAVFDRRSDVSDSRIREWNETENKNGGQILNIYLAIHQFGITREHFIEACEYHGIDAFSEKDIDVLFSDDVTEFRKHFKSSVSFFYEGDGYLYNIKDLPLCDKETLCDMDKNGELTAYLEYILSGDIFYDPNLNVGGWDDVWGNGNWKPFFEIHGVFIVNTLEMLNPGKTYELSYSIETAPQTGTPIVPLAITALLAASFLSLVMLTKRSGILKKGIDMKKL